MQATEAVQFLELGREAEFLVVRDCRQRAEPACQDIFVAQFDTVDCDIAHRKVGRIQPGLYRIFLLRNVLVCGNDARMGFFFWVEFISKYEHF